MWAVKLDRDASASGPTVATPAHASPAYQDSVRRTGQGLRDRAAHSPAA